MIPLINPLNKQPLLEKDGVLTDGTNEFVMKNGAWIFSPDEGYTSNFGYQWNIFKRTQIDKFSGYNFSEARFFAVTEWPKNRLEGENILEVGSGAGRFTQIVMDHTKANLYTADYSDAVFANYTNNGPNPRLHIFRASLFELPFAENSFDKAFCFGVLQHTPNPAKAVQAVGKHVKPGGELLVDFYPYNGFWTLIHHKYMFRFFYKKLSNLKLLDRIKKRVKFNIKAYNFLHRIRMGFMTRFLFISNIRDTMPQDISKDQLEEWVVLDTFDMYSARYDRPQKVKKVRRYFEEAGFEVTFAGTKTYENGKKVTFVKGIKKQA